MDIRDLLLMLEWKQKGYAPIETFTLLSVLPLLTILAYWTMCEDKREEKQFFKDIEVLLNSFQEKREI